MTCQTDAQTIVEAMRVLFVVPGEPEGSSMIFVKRQMESLRKMGVVIDEVYLTSRTSTKVLLKEYKKIKEKVRKFKPDLIHAHYGTVTGFICAIATRTPLIITFRGCDLNVSPDISLFRSCAGRFLSQLAALRAKKIICVSNQLKDRLWWRRKSVTIIPSGVDTTKFYPRPMDKTRLLLGWHEKELVVLFNAGKNPKRKRLDLAQSSVEHAKKICGEIKFVVLTGDVDPEWIPILMNGADCLLMTSVSEGSPNVVKEAIACNLPVVSVYVADVSERLVGVYPSRTVDENPKIIGSALAEVLMKRNRSNGYEVIRELSLEKIAKRIELVYKSAVPSK